MDGPIVMRIAGAVDQISANPDAYPELIEQIGGYVVRYEPARAKQGQQWIWTSKNIAEAQQFEDAGQAHACYRQDIGIRPWDGRPDRPITVFHVAFEPVE